MKKVPLPKVSEKLKLQKIAFDLVERLRKGELIVFPTENSYVVVADPHNEIGVNAFREIKGHDPKTIYPIFVNTTEELQPFTEEINDKVKLLTQEFWPGMLNLVLTARDVPLHNFGSTEIPDRLIARKPKNILINAVVELSGPLIYSALRTVEGEVVKDLTAIPTAQKKLISIAIDNGKLRSKGATTLLNCMGNHFVIQREGSITAWELKKFVPEIIEG